MIRLIATDIDGTLIDASHRPSASTLAALTRARDEGVLVVPTSGRQPFSIAEVLRDTWLAEGLVIGANGAVATDLGTGEIMFEHSVSVEAQTELFLSLRELFPSLVCVSVRDGGDTFWPEAGYVGMMDPGDHGRGGVLPHYPLDVVLGSPSLKLVVRGRDVEPEELREAAQRLEVPGVSVSTSGAPFLEVAAAGVNKASGLEAVCATLGIAPDEVVAFGDNNNDLEMIAWAGIGVAMGNALPEVRKIADVVTGTNLDDGVASVVEELAANGWGPPEGASQV